MHAFIYGGARMMVTWWQNVDQRDDQFLMCFENFTAVQVVDAEPKRHKAREQVVHVNLLEKAEAFAVQCLCYILI